MSDAGMPSDPEISRSKTKPLSYTVYNERIKYTATWLNTIAAGAIVVGVVAPLTAWAMGGALDTSVFVSLAWLPVGGALHYFCLRLLLRLKEQERTDERN